MARKKKQPPHENHERWLVSYADFITLLFATFAALFAISNADLEKLANFQGSIREAFNVPNIGRPGMTLLGGESGGGAMVITILPGSAGISHEDKPATTSQPYDPEEPFLGDTLFPDRSEDPSEDNYPWADPTPAPTHRSVIGGGLGSGEGAGDPILATQLREMFEMAGLGNDVEVRQEARGTVISLGEAAFFATGEIDVLPESFHKLDRIINVLRTRRFHIRIEGHTDNVPITSGRWRDNWELSVLRATRICSYMKENYNYDPTLLSPAGYGEWRPIADNDTEEGRQKNRRIDIVILSQDFSRFEP